MKDFIILPDSTCDISKEAMADIGMTEYICGHVNYNGEDLPTKLEWEPFTREEYYKTLSNKKAKVSTAPPSPAEYVETFTKYVNEGKAIISICLSSKISSTYSVACNAAKEVKEKYPEAEIYVFDTFRMSGAIGLLTYYAYVLKNEGKSFEEVIAWLEENKRRVHQMGPIDDLIFVARRGRISMGKAIMGSFAGVKPMGDCNADGYTSVITKAKGIGKALDITVRYVQETATDIKNQVLFVVHSNRELYANTLKEKLEALNPKKIYVTDVHSACGGNIGPGMIGVYYLGEEVSADLVKEKEIMNKIVGK